MSPDRGRSGGVGTSVAIVAIFLALFHWVGVETWGHGRRTILRMLAIAAVVLLAPAIRRVEARIGTAAMIGATAIAASAWLAMRLGQALFVALATPGLERSAIDIARNVDAAATHLLAGHNPYVERAQLGHVVGPGPHVTVVAGETRMYGLRYPYGFPYFPSMIAAYLPFRQLAPHLHAIRVGNAFYLLAGALGAAWLAFRSVAKGARTLAVGLALLASVAIEVLAPEHFTLAVTDICISAVAVFAFVAASYRRPILTGVLLGLVQAAKLLPGPLVALPAIASFASRRERAIAFGAYVAVSLALIVPAIVPDPEAFAASTIAFYLTYHGGGDDTSLYWFLPDAAKPVFLLVGLTIAAFFALRGFRGAPPSTALAARDAWLAYFLFTAFNRMTHLNYLWSVHALGAVAVATAALTYARSGDAART